MNFKTQFDALISKCSTVNASGHKCFSLGMLDDENIRWITENCPSWDWLDITDDGGNNLFDIAREKGFLPDNIA